jgi:hypothetical protein
MDNSFRPLIGNFEWPASVTGGDRREVIREIAERQGQSQPLAAARGENTSKVLTEFQSGAKMEILQVFSITRGERWCDVCCIAGNPSLWLLRSL